MTRLAVSVEDRTFSVEVANSSVAGQLDLRLDHRAVCVRIQQPGAGREAPGWLLIDGRPFEIELDPELHWIASGTGRHHLEVRDLEDITVRAINGNGQVKAPIPGQITRLCVAEGQNVTADQALCVLEAMKMENEIRAPRAGVVSALLIAVGHIVSRGQLLAEIGSC